VGQSLSRAVLYVAALCLCIDLSFNYIQAKLTEDHSLWLRAVRGELAISNLKRVAEDFQN